MCIRDRASPLHRQWGSELRGAGCGSARSAGMEGEEKHGNVTTNLSAALLVCVRMAVLQGTPKALRCLALSTHPGTAWGQLTQNLAGRSPPPRMSPSSRPHKWASRGATEHQHESPQSLCSWCGTDFTDSHHTPSARAVSGQRTPQSEHPAAGGDGIQLSWQLMVHPGYSSSSPIISDGVGGLCRSWRDGSSVGLSGMPPEPWESPTLSCLSRAVMGFTLV